MTLDEALRVADNDKPMLWSDIDPLRECAPILAAEVRRLQSPRSGVCQIGPPKQIAPTNWPAWGMIDETDEEFADRAGKPFTEVVR